MSPSLFTPKFSEPAHHLHPAYPLSLVAASQLNSSRAPGCRAQRAGSCRVFLSVLTRLVCIHMRSPLLHSRMSPHVRLQCHMTVSVNLPSVESKNRIGVAGGHAIIHHMHAGQTLSACQQVQSCIPCPDELADWVHRLWAWLKHACPCPDWGYRGPCPGSRQRGNVVARQAAGLRPTLPIYTAGSPTIVVVSQHIEPSLQATPASPSPRRSPSPPCHTSCGLS